MKIKKGDIIITVGLVIISLLMSFGLSQIGSNRSGQVLRIEKDSVVIEEIPLDVDNEVVIDDGVHYNKIVIKDGKATMDSANCPDQICTHMHDIQLDGETIICLPNRVFLEVVDLSADDGIDKINR